MVRAPYKKEEIRMRLVNFRQRHPDISLAKIEKMTEDVGGRRVSKATLSLLVNKKLDSLYKDENGKSDWSAGNAIAESILKTIDTYESKIEKPVETTTLQIILSAAERNIGNSSILVICGESGTGKTTAFKEYTRNHPEVIAITANTAMKTRALFKELCKATKAYYAQRSTPHDILIELREINPPQIIFDEADSLTPHCFNLLRDLRDMADTSLVFLGLPCILRKLTTSSDKLDNLVQLYSRIDFFKRLDLPKDAEIRKIVQHMGIKKTDVITAIIKKSVAAGMNNLHKTECIVRALKDVCITQNKSLDEIPIEWVDQITKDMIA